MKTAIPVQPMCWHTYYSVGRWKAATLDPSGDFPDHPAGSLVEMFTRTGNRR